MNYTNIKYILITYACKNSFLFIRRTSDPCLKLRGISKTNPRVASKFDDNECKGLFTRVSTD